MGEGQPAELTAWIIVAVLVMLGLAGLVIVVSRLAMVRIVREQEKQRQAELLHQQELLQNSIQVQERERKRLAAELHDDLSSVLNVLRLQLYPLKDSWAEAPEALKLLDRAIATSRNISHELYPPLLAEFGLIESVRDFIQPLCSRLDIVLTCTGPEAMEPRDDTALQLFRLVQELVANALKHARCDQLSLRFRWSRNYHALLCVDNGRGFHTGQVRTGLGLQNIESRLRAVGGQHRIRSTPGRGTQTFILIPRL